MTLDPAMVAFVRAEIDAALASIDVALGEAPVSSLRVAEGVRAFASVARLSGVDWAESVSADLSAELERSPLDTTAIARLTASVRAKLAGGPGLGSAPPPVSLGGRPLPPPPPPPRPATIAPPEPEGLSPTLLEAFREDVDTQLAVLQDGVLELESRPDGADVLERLMRAAHSLKGAARVARMTPVLDVAHALEDAFVASQRGDIQLDADDLDVLLVAVDTLASALRQGLARGGKLDPEGEGSLRAVVPSLRAVAEGAGGAAAKAVMAAPARPAPGVVVPAAGDDRVVRVSAEMADRLLGLAGESVVEAQRIGPASDALTKLRLKQLETYDLAQSLVGSVRNTQLDPIVGGLLAELAANVAEGLSLVGLSTDLLKDHGRRAGDVATRLYDGVLTSRMRPLRDRTRGLARMARDLSRQLGKRVVFECRGEDTLVDRDVLERLEAPLGHLVRNSIDHGIETAEERQLAGKPETGKIVLEAIQARGMIRIEVRDDGGGVDRRAVLERARSRGLVAESMAESLRDDEILDLIFLPGFSTAREVSDISGRGVGLDVVRRSVTEVGGSVRIVSVLGKGTTFALEAPITRSIVRCLLVRIADEIYAVPLGRVDRVLRLAPADLRSLEGREYVDVDGRNVGVLRASDVLGVGAARRPRTEMAALVMGNADGEHALVVEAFLGEEDLVVRRLDDRLRGVRNIMAAATLDDGSLVLILDVDDVLRSVEAALAAGQRVAPPATAGGAERRRILVVDDAVTVREAERQLLTARGYDVDVAVDGMDGWNAVRSAVYDLVVTDIDMPRMDGFELVRAIKADARTARTPVVIVSYKDREEDRLQGLQAGADAYLKKGSFDDRALLEVVRELIGGPER